MENQNLNEFAPANINNERIIIRELMKKWEKCKSSRLAHRIENLTGWSVDFDDGDLTDEPRGWEHNK